ncbi:helix-turn-helix transcriptional regulator [Serratia marcescens]|uniref:XRE family transcriptional regulator n=1 Tax=Serratia marcescens TaxID=615 RepID=UPI0030D2AC0B
MSSSTFAERLKKAMESAGYTQVELANRIGVTQGAIQKLVSGKAKSTRNIIGIAEALGVSPHWLSSGDGEMRHDERSSIPPRHEWQKVSPWDSSTPLDDDEVEVPFLRDIELAAGDGSYCEEDYNGFKLRFSKATLRRVGAKTDGSGVLCFPARGDSMEPNIPDGTTVAVNTDDKKIVDGKVYAINENGWKRIKLLYRVGPDRVSIRSYNKEEHPDEDRLITEVEVIGRVFWWSVISY